MDAIKAFFSKSVVKYVLLGVVAVALLGTGGFFVIRHFRAPTEPVANTTVEIPFDDSEYTVLTEPDTTDVGVTDEFGSVVTQILTTNKSSTTKKVSSTKKKTPAASSGSSGTISEGQKYGANSTAHKNPDGSVSVVDEDGSIALSYSYDKAGNYFYTENDPWQRNFGFTEFYDVSAKAFGMYYDTVRVKFTYGKYDWMVQLWKGQYGYLFIGSEIGLYYKNKGTATDHYSCATEDMELYMQMTLYREGTGELFTRPYAKHWWITAFVPGKLKKFTDRSELTMVGKIDFASEGMRKAFCNALESCVDDTGRHFKYSSKVSRYTPETYTYRGNVVDLVWCYLDADMRSTTTTKKTTAAPTTVPVVTTPAPTTTHKDPVTILPPVTIAPKTEAPTETTTDEPVSIDPPVVD